VPTAADVAIFDQAATYTVTFNFATTLSVLEILNTAGTVTFNGTTTTGLNLGGLTLTATAVWSCLTANIQFGKTGTYVIDTKGVLLRDVTFSVSTATRTLGSDLYARNASVDAGVLNLNGYTLTADKLDCSGTGTRTLAFGTGQITLVGGEIYTLELNYASIVMTGSKRINISSPRTGFTFVIPKNYGINLYVTQGAFDIIFGGAGTVNTLDGTGYTGRFQQDLSITGNLTLAAGTTWIGGTVTFSGAGTKLVTTNGTALPAVTVNASGATVQLQDALTAAGVMTLTAGTLDLNGYTLIASALVSNNLATRTLAFGAGQITLVGLDATILNLTSSGLGLTLTGSKRVNISSPRTASATVAMSTQSINLYVTQGSFAIVISGSSTVGTLDCTGYSGQIQGNLSVTGDLVLSAGTTWENSRTVTFTGTGTKLVTSNGAVFPALNVNAVGGVVQLQDALTAVVATRLVAGTLDLNGNTLTTEFLFSTGLGATRTLAFGVGQITLVGALSTTENMLIVDSGFPFGTTMTGSRRINVSSTRTTFARVNANDRGVNLYITQGSYTLALQSSTLATLDSTGYSGSLEGLIYVSGNVTLGVGSTLVNANIDFEGVTTQLLTSNGVAVQGVGIFGFGTVRLQDSLIATDTVRLYEGALDLNGHDITTRSFQASASYTGELNTLAFGTGQIIITAPSPTDSVSVYIDYTYDEPTPGLVLTGSKRIVFESADASYGDIEGGDHEIDLYVTQGAYTLDVEGIFGDIDFTGFSGEVTTNYSSGFFGVSRDLTVGVGMTMDRAVVHFYDTGAKLFTPNAVSIYQVFVYLGAVQLQGALTATAIQMYGGEFDLNGHLVEAQDVYLYAYNPNYYPEEPTNTVLILNDSLLRVGVTFILYAPTLPATEFPVITGPGTIEIFGASGFFEAQIGWTNEALADARVAAFPVVRHTGSVPLRVYGSNTFQSLESLSAAGSVTFSQGNTNTFGTFDVSGAPGNLKTLTAALGEQVATQATLIKGSPWLVGANSVDAGNNTGLTFVSGGGIDYLEISNIATTDPPIDGWVLISDSQTANWQNASNAQTPNWQNIIDVQSPGWTPTNQ
jgi:hypothetical protein